MNESVEWSYHLLHRIALRFQYNNASNVVYSRHLVSMNSLHSLEFVVTIVHKVPATIQWMVLFKTRIVVIFEKVTGISIDIYFALFDI